MLHFNFHPGHLEVHSNPNALSQGEGRGRYFCSGNCHLVHLLAALSLKSESHFRGLGPALGTRDECKFVVLAVQESQAGRVSEG